MISEPVTLADGVADQLLVDGVAPIDRNAAGLAALQRQRLGRRGHAPLPSGGLFDETARQQGELF